MDQDLKDEFVQDERRSLSKLQETILFGVARYWMGIVFAVAVGACIGLYLGASKPNIYLSSAKLLLRIGEREGLTEESLAGIATQRESRPTMEDEIHMLTDRAVFQKVIEEVTPAAFLQSADPTRYDDPETTPLPVQWMHQLQNYLIKTRESGDNLKNFTPEDQVLVATEILIKDTVVFPNTGSNVITVLHYSTSPEKAQYTTSKLVDAFRTRHKQQFSLERLIPGQELAVSEAREKFFVAKENLDNYFSENNFSDLDAEIASGFESVTDSRDQLVTAKALLGGKTSELASLTGQLNSEKAIKLDPEQKYALETREIELTSEVSGLQVQVEQLDLYIKTQEERNKELAGLRPKLRTLNDALEAARTDYETKRELGDRLSALAKIDDSNLSVLQEPNLPIEKEGPKRLKLMILGVAAGLGLGGLIAVLRQAFDRNLRYPSTVERWSGLQLLAVIPESPDVRRLQRVRHFI